MYPRSKFQEILLAIREEMAREADFDVDLFAELVRSGVNLDRSKTHQILENTDVVTNGTDNKPSINGKKLR